MAKQLECAEESEELGSAMELYWSKEPLAVITLAFPTTSVICDHEMLNQLELILCL